MKNYKLQSPIVVKAIAWDFDGTIVDNQHIYFTAIRESFSHTKHVFNFKQEGEGRSLQDFYLSLPVFLKQNISFEQWSKKISRTCFEKLDHLHIRPGVKILMDECKTRGIPQVCVSNSQKQSLLERLEKLELLDYFQHVIGFDDVSAPKPSPMPYTLACQKLKTPPQNVLAIEDSPTGIQSAQEAGLITAAYPINQHTKHFFKEACLIVQDISEIRSLL